MHTRELTLGRADKKARSVPVTLSTETPVDRGGYIEVLDHASGSVDLSRAPLPLIESHDRRSLPIGVVDGLRIDGRRLRGVATFGNSQRAQEVFQDVQDGILRNVSLGYEYVGNPTEQADGKTLRFKFRPLEASAVSVPADPNAGFFRSYHMNTIDTNTDTQSSLTRRQRRRDRELDDDRMDRQIAEQNRRLEIRAMCRIHRCEHLSQQMIDEGYPLDDARAAVLQDQLQRQQQPVALLGNTSGDPLMIGMSGREADQYSLTRALLAASTGDWRRAGMERAASDAIAKQRGRETNGFFVPMDALVREVSGYYTGSPAAGGAIVATNLMAGSFIEVLRKQTRVIQLGATMLSGLVGNVDVPRRTAPGATQWIAEGGELTQVEGAFDKVSLTPKTIGSLSLISRNLLMQSTPDVEMLIRSDMIAQLAIGIDTAAIAGAAANGQPVGILNTSGIGSVEGGVDGAAITFDHLIDLSTRLAAANADLGSLAFLTTPNVVGALSKLKTQDGIYLWPNRGGAAALRPAPAGAVPGATTYGAESGFSVLGFPLAATNTVPSNLTKGTSEGVCSAVIFGNWADVVIGEWGVLEVLPNPYDSTAYKQGAVLVRALQSLDVAVRHPESFAAMTDALTA